MCKDFDLKRNSLLLEQTLHWQPSLNQLEQFTQLQFLLREWNKRVNLTRLIEDNDFWISQIIDSLWPIKNEHLHSKESKKIIDVGSGCGFPGLAIAIALPKASLVLVDSIKRKTIALKDITRGLGLHSRVHVINERVELLGQNSSYRGSFDLSLARAVASTPVVAEYLIPFLNNTGEALIYKGKWNPHELKGLNNALIPLQGKIKEIQCLDLPDKRGVRHVITITGSKECPKKFPRGVGIPNKKPLGNQSFDNL